MALSHLIETCVQASPIHMLCIIHPRCLLDVCHIEGRPPSLQCNASFSVANCLDIFIKASFLFTRDAPIISPFSQISSTFFWDKSSSNYLVISILIWKFCSIHQWLCRQCTRIHIIMILAFRTFQLITMEVLRHCHHKPFYPHLKLWTPFDGLEYHLM